MKMFGTAINVLFYIDLNLDSLVNPTENSKTQTQSPCDERHKRDTNASK